MPATANLSPSSVPGQPGRRANHPTIDTEASLEALRLYLEAVNAGRFAAACPHRRRLEALGLEVNFRPRPSMRERRP
jgi:hypothetical protein